MKNSLEFALDQALKLKEKIQAKLTELKELDTQVKKIEKETDDLVKLYNAAYSKARLELIYIAKDCKNNG